MGKRNILIVEDEFITALDIKMRLTTHGYNAFDNVGTGEEAIKIVENEKVDLILMDIKLKGKIDGIEAAQIINKKYNIPIIYMSGNTDMHKSDRLKATNPAGIIGKPIMEYELFETINNALNNTD